MILRNARRENEEHDVTTHCPNKKAADGRIHVLAAADA